MAEHCSRRWFKLAVVCLLGLACFAFAGCDSQQKSLSREQSNLKKLLLLYRRFVSQHQGNPPASEAEFKQFVKSLAGDDLTSLGIRGSSDVFVSERDGKPYVVIYGRVQGPAGPGGLPVVVYEQEGVAGKRWIGSAVGAVEEVDPSRFQKVVPASKSP